MITIEFVASTLHLTPFQVSSLEEAFEKYLDYCVKTSELKLKKIRKPLWKNLRKMKKIMLNY